MKKPILLFALKCTAIIYFVAFADVTSFTTASGIAEDGVTFKSTQRVGIDKTSDSKEPLYLTKL